MKTLLIVDLQKGFGATEDLVEKINQLAADYETVVATKFVNGNSLFQNVLKYLELSEQEMELEKLPENTKVFKKTGYGLPDELLSFLKKNNVVKVDVCGLETDACVLAAMYSLWDASIQPNLLQEFSKTPKEEMQQAACAISNRNFGTK